MLIWKMGVVRSPAQAHSSGCTFKAQIAFAKIAEIATGRTLHYFVFSF
jgi:hypothetical protein